MIDFLTHYLRAKRMDRVGSSEFRKIPEFEGKLREASENPYEIGV
jgi:hypothetical protein